MNIHAHHFDITADTIDLIEGFEGFSNSIYCCPAFKPTVGFGHVVLNTDLIAEFSGHFLRRSFFAITKTLPSRRDINTLLHKIYPCLMTRAQGIKLLKSDLKQVLKIMRDRVKVKLNKNQSSALISFIYNIGVGAFAKSTLLRKLNKKDFIGAAKEFERWIYVQKRRSKGLIKRRQAEKALFMQPLTR
ncbi:MAG: lysozyme [Pseudomonadota bacterium]